MNLIVGTAGHIDHGKTTLIKALTGTDTDRLPEEKQRGITIDLGFAELAIGDLKIGFVDVPGHERFVKNMLAGAGGIDIVLLVVAADEGVMPQTREHFEICRLLGTSAGLVVISKCDLVDDETLDLAKLDVADLVDGSFIENAPVIEVSAKTGAGITELTKALEDAARRIRPRENVTVARLPVDRVFSVKGFGAVVTGTLLAGIVSEADELELLPAGKRVRVRGVESAGRSVRSAFAGQRTALNLGGIEQSELSRGMVLAEPDVLVPTQMIDSLTEVLSGAKRPLRSRQRVRFHIGTSEVLARVHVLNENGEIPAGEKGFVQFRFESPVIALSGDRFVIRTYSPQATVAGGEVLDAHGRKHRGRDRGLAIAFLERLGNDRTDPETKCRHFVEAGGERGISIRDLRGRTGFTSDITESVL
ncbi:MAG TPA: selenocysteine-specific translation elongation factor, partial [Pyrinomonadaceae bacterium]|nr:selenocysteine-specific translation elongation factor [Pyrinomonadaceae bacterium]